MASPETQNDHELKPFLGECKILTKCSKVATLEEAIESTGTGKFTFFLAVVCGMCMLSGNVEYLQISFILPVAQCELELDSFKKGLLASCNLAGIISSGFLWGPLTDIKGRKPFLVYNLAASFVLSVVSAFMPTLWSFLIMRFLNGVCISAPCFVTFCYLEEFQNSKNRPKSFTITAQFVGLALIALPGFGWLFLQNNNISFNFFGLMQLNNWRLYILFNSLATLSTSLMLTQFPEGPKFLYYNGRSEESLEVLRKMYRWNTGGSSNDFGIEQLAEKEPLTVKSDSRISQILILLKPPYLLYTISVCILQSGFFILSSGLYAWYPDIINQLSENEGASLKVCDVLGATQNSLNQTIDTDTILCKETFDSQIFILNIIIGLFYMVGYISYGAFVKFLGCRNFLVIAMVISSIAVFSLQIASQKLLIDVLFIISLVLPGICVTITAAWTAEIFPTQVGGIVVCITITIGRLSTVISSALAGIMIEWNCRVTFATYGVCLLVCLLFCLVLPKKS